MGVIDRLANDGWETDASAGDGTSVIRRKFDTRPAHERIADGWSVEAQSWKDYPGTKTAQTDAIAQRYLAAVGAIRSLPSTDARIRELNLLADAYDQAQQDLFDALTSPTEASTTSSEEAE